MRLTDTLILYSLLGLAFGLLLAKPQPTPHKKLAFVLMSICFWPLLLPLLKLPEDPQTPQKRQKHLQPGPFALKLEEQFSRLTLTLRHSDDLASSLLNQNSMLLESLQTRLAETDHQLAELNALLNTPSFELQTLQHKMEQAQQQASPRALESIQAQHDNVKALKALKDTCQQTLEESLAVLERLHSDLTLLRFTHGESDKIYTELERLLALLDGVQQLPPSPNFPGS